MLGIALLVFREVLEAALIVTIVAAATRGVHLRGGFIGGGVALGVIGAIVVAMFAGVIEQAVGGSGQELFAACVLLAAVAMIAWHVIWMSSHGCELVRQMQTLGDSVKTGSSSLAMLLAAGLSSTAAGFLIQANGLPVWGNQLWNTSWLLGNGSLGGQALHILVSYEARPAGMQLVFWTVTIAALVSGMRWAANRLASARARQLESSVTAAPDSRQAVPIS